MGWPRMRSFGCNFIGDVLAYAPPEGIPGPGDFYYDVNKMLEETYDAIAREYPKSKKVVIAHSMGTQISFGFSWRRELSALITMGSPILYFSLRFKEYGKFPDVLLKSMFNFWTNRDPVCTRISRNPNLAKCKDVEVPNWNPLNWLPLRAHSMYFKSDFVHKEIAKILQM